MTTRWVRAVSAFTVAVVVLTSCGTGGDDDATDGTDVTVDDAANPTTPSGEGAGGGPPPDGSTTSSSDPDGDDTDLPGGAPIQVTGTLSGVAAGPDESLWLCHLLRTDQGTFALEFIARQYEVVANETPAQLEIRDADTGDPVAGLGDDVAVEGIRHPDPVPVAGRSYACEGVAAYLRVSHIEVMG